VEELNVAVPWASGMRSDRAHRMGESGNHIIDGMFSYEDISFIWIKIATSGIGGMFSIEDTSFYMDKNYFGS